MDSDWRKPTRATSFDFIFDRPGTYTFDVQAIDRDLNYSEPASIELTVVSPFYLRTIFLIPTMGSCAIVLTTLVFLATALVKRRRQVHAYELMAVRELQDARGMQMSLLPETAPPVEGMEIAGRSIPANIVGGDFFDYLALADGKVGIGVADVSGKGLRAAMNATMANGMMHEVATIEASCGRILSRLNAHLYPLMEKQMFTAFLFAIIDQDAGLIRWSNAAQPHPLIKLSSGASEAEEDGQLPLSMAPGTKYPDCELRLQIGDIVIFYTDGIIEAENEAEEMYGTERLLNLVSGIDTSASAEDAIEAILQDVSDFAGAAQQYDDMTVVVLRKV
jgi:sigma-B regulation protein RsbU (phosphoserine phosphatase)